MKKMINGELVDMTDAEIASLEASRATDPATVLAQWRETSFIPRAEFCINANTMGLLSDADAELASSGAWPTAFEPIIANWPLAQRIRARNKWATNANIYRSDPLLNQLGALTTPELTPEQLDQLCGWVS